ncbi:MAG: type II secretion system F family protein [Bryobacteraceae bacterium]|nr:type II secretion system F family protein [Bryobacteraceae bacterium]
MGFILILLLVWITSVGIWYVLSGVVRKSDVDRIRQRLHGAPKEKKKASEDQPKELIQREDTVTGRVTVRLLHKYALHDKLQEMLEQAGLKWKVPRLIHACMACFIGTYVLAWQLAGLRTIGLLLAAGAAALPVLFVSRKKTKRLEKFEEQFPESLEFVARSMRAGHAFSVSLEMIHREFQEPLASEFKRTFEEHNLGLPLETSLLKLAKRVPLLDVHFFVSAVLLQKRTGGNLAEILDKLAYVIRERFKLRGRIRAVSAHGRMTGMALTMIPVGCAVILFYVNPYYATFFFTDETGHYMAGAAIALQLIGYAIIQKIVTIEV